MAQGISHVTSVTQRAKETRESCNHPGWMSYVSPPLTWEGGSRYSPTLGFQTPSGRSEIIWHGWRKDACLKLVFPPYLHVPKCICMLVVSLLPWRGRSSWAWAGDSQWVQWSKPGKKKIRKVNWNYCLLYSLESLRLCYCLHMLWWMDPVSNSRHTLIRTSKGGQFN